MPEQAYAFLDNFTKKYREQRGIGLISTGTASYWNGHLDEAAHALALAADYPEVFGYTSFTRTHYDAMLRSQQGAVYEAMAHRMDFEPALADGFFERLWERIVRFVRKLVYTFMSFLSRHWATDKYLQFEDRREFLKPWYTENPLDYYQFWTILRRLDPEWHLARLREARASDVRPRAGRYYALYEAGFLHAQGNDAAAHRILAGTGRPLWETVDTAYEKLLGAMAIDLDIAVTDDLGMEEQRRLTVELYRRYPQTVLLWGHRLPLAFRSGDVNLGLVPPDKRKDIEDMLDTFRDFDFDFSETDQSIPALRLGIEARGDTLLYSYQVTLNGAPIASGQISSMRKHDGAIMRLTPGDIAKELAYGVFRITPRNTAL
ncbi:MAG: hypothetical protein IPP94_02660 [Ignavibacteria bacterium]|nr:hypothetical protein [Ignavibacteria bacterium]